MSNEEQGGDVSRTVAAIVASRDDTAAFAVARAKAERGRSPFGSFPEPRAMSDAAPLDLTALRTLAREATERAGKATPGPWIAREADAFKRTIIVCDSSEFPARTRGLWVFQIDCPMESIAADDAAFVAHARTDVPALASAVERLADALEMSRLCDELAAASAKAYRAERDDAANAALTARAALEAERDVRAEADRSVTAAMRIAEAVTAELETERAQSLAAVAKSQGAFAKLMLEVERLQQERDSARETVEHVKRDLAEMTRWRDEALKMVQEGEAALAQETADRQSYEHGHAKVLERCHALEAQRDRGLRILEAAGASPDGGEAAGAAQVMRWFEEAKAQAERLNRCLREAEIQRDDNAGDRDAYEDSLREREAEVARMRPVVEAVIAADAADLPDDIAALARGYMRS